MVFVPSEFLIPRDKSHLSSWSTVAADQQTEFSSTTDRVVTTIKLCPPEREVNVTDVGVLKSIVFSATCAYNSIPDLFETIEGFVYVERSTSEGVRRGLVSAMDLDEFAFDPTSDYPGSVRASEEVVTSRVEKRLLVKEVAMYDVSHAIIFIDDEMDSIIGSLAINAREGKLRSLYDFTLDNGQRVRGFAVEGEVAQETAERLFLYESRRKDLGQLVGVVGDGNHSLAINKIFYEKNKIHISKNSRMRFAAVELVNIRTSPDFHPIHRIVDTNYFHVKEYLNEKACEYGIFDRPDNVKILSPYYGTEEDTGFDLRTFQTLIEEYCKENSCEIRYIHDLEDQEEGWVTFISPSYSRTSLFKDVQDYGRLPKKTFSVGCSEDKRYYIEIYKFTD